MALMKFREPNQVRWIGSRPAHNGTQVSEYRATNVAGITNLLPAQATQTQYITYFFISTEANGSNNVLMELRTPVPAIVWVLGVGRGLLAYKGEFASGSFWPPLEVLPTYTIDLELSGAVWCAAGVLGWIE